MPEVSSAIQIGKAEPVAQREVHIPSIGIPIDALHRGDLLQPTRA